MDQLTSLFFPDTVVVPTAMAQALLFFEKIHHYLPAERSLADNGKYHLLYNENLCYGFAPAPLGTDIERFHRVIKDMKTPLSVYC